MKHLFIGVLLLGSFSALACVNQGKMVACIGDKAFVSNGDGEIVGVNPVTKKVSIDFNKGGSRYSGMNTYEVGSITIGKGCVSNLCVGDKVIIQKGDGEVVGVNPITKMISIDFDKGRGRYSGLNTYKADQIETIGKGCLLGF